MTATTPSASVSQTLFENNITALRDYHPALAHHFLSRQMPPAGEIDASSGVPNLLINNNAGQYIALHQPDPIMEQATYLSRVPEDSNGVVLLMGMGLGYPAMAILRERPRIQKMVIFDRDPSRLWQALHVVDLTPLLSDGRVTLHLGSSPEVNSALEPIGIPLQLEDTHLLRHIPSFSLDPAYHELCRAVFECANQYNVAGASSIQQGPLFLRNRLRNLMTQHHHRWLDELRGRFRGIPTILIANGPSLDQDLAQLRQLQDHALLLAADSSLPTLLSAGIRPHFVSCLDANNIIYEKIAECTDAAANLSLLCVPQVTHCISDTFPARQIFWSMGNSIFEQHFASLLSLSTVNENMATVAHLNLLAAIVMESSPIIFVGQDLSYPAGEKTHSEMTALTCREFLKKAKSSETDYVRIPGINNTEVYTDRGLFNAKIHLEEIITAHPGRYINATSAGASIKGTEEIPLTTVCSRFCSPPLSITRLLEPAARPGNDSTRRRDIFRAEIDKLAAETESVRKLIGRSRLAANTSLRLLTKELCKKNPPESLEKFSVQLIRQLENMEAVNQEIESHKFLWTLLQDLTLNGLRQGNRILRSMEILKERNAPFPYLVKKHLAWHKTVADERERALSFFHDHLRILSLFLAREEALQNPEETTQSRFALAEFYLEAGQIAKARELFAGIAESNGSRPDLLLHLGNIAALHRQNEKSEQLFTQAIRLDPAMAEEVEQRRQAIAGSFLELSLGCEKLDIDRRSSLRLLAKGLAFCPSHEDSRNELKSRADAELPAIEQSLQENTFSPDSPVAQAWLYYGQNHTHLLSLLPAHQQGIILQALATSSMDTDPAEAIELFHDALTCLPETAAIHLSLVALLLDSGQYARAIDHLKKAVALDRSAGVYWEQLGDILLGSELFEDAIHAYEQAFLAIPEQLDLLAKIGNCYRSLGKGQAAAEAYRHYMTMQKSDFTTHVND